MAERGERLPGVQHEDRIVCHVDMDCFYAACERLREPELVDEPVVVGMGYEDGDDGGAVATASYEARAFGVESAQAITTALDRLPRKAEVDDESDAGYYRPVDMEYYQSVAGAVRDILRDWADVVREVSIDEAYLDVTSRTDWSVVEGYARHIKQEIDRQVGVTASVGVAPNMSTSKVASDYDKPDGLVVVSPDRVEDFLTSLDIHELHGIGPVTASELREAGIDTVGDLADRDESWLVDRYGDRGRDLHRRANGIDDRAVEPVGKPKSLSRESAFAQSVESTDRKRERVTTLAAALADRARRKGALYRTIGIKVVEPPFEIHTRSRTLSGPVDDPTLLQDVALELLEEFDSTPIRKVGVRVANLEFSAQDQSALDGWDDQPVTENVEVPTESSEDPRDRQLLGQTTLADFC